MSIKFVAKIKLLLFLMLPFAIIFKLITMSKNTLFLIAFLAFVIIPSQKKESDTLITKKMIIGSLKENVKVAVKVNEKCQLEGLQSFDPIHDYLAKVAIVTDYLFCNNGIPNMFFEIYDGYEFKYVRDIDITFPDNYDKENLKVVLSKRSPEEKDFVHKNVNRMADFVKDFGEDQEEEEISDNVGEALQPFIEVEKYGLGIIKYNATDDYASTGAAFKIFNPTKKTIKYIWFTVAGENAVGDLVKSGGIYYKTLKGIGPVESYGIGSWSFDYVWFTDIIEYLKISTIKIQYMDGSIKTIKYNSSMYIGENAYDNLNITSTKKSEFEKKQKAKNILSNNQNVFSEVDIDPEFPGGNTFFKSKIKENITVGKYGKSEFTFIVEKDGTISDITAIGDNDSLNAEIIHAIKSIKNIWSPAKINSAPVRYRYKSLINID